jgi:hypothetical protein
MKKMIALTMAAFLVSGVSFAGTGQGDQGDKGKGKKKEKKEKPMKPCPGKECKKEPPAKA